MSVCVLEHTHAYIVKYCLWFQTFTGAWEHALVDK